MREPKTSVLTDSCKRKAGAKRQRCLSKMTVFSVGEQWVHKQNFYHRQKSRGKKQNVYSVDNL
jgi:hypothetical protein